MIGKKWQHGKRAATIVVILLLAALGLGAVFYFHHPAANAVYISSQYSTIKIPATFKLKNASVTDAAPDDPSLPASGNYTYDIAQGVSPLQALNSLRQELIREGFKSTTVNTYSVNGSFDYIFSADNNNLYLVSRILEDTTKTTVIGTDDNKLTVFAVHSSK